LSDGSGVCLWHSDDPARKAQAELARRTGMALSRLRGRNWRPGRALCEPDDWLTLINAAVNDLAATPNNHHRVASLVALSREAREWTLLRAALPPTLEGEITRGQLSG
jgi:hypothetical protein